MKHYHFGMTYILISNKPICCYVFPLTAFRTEPVGHVSRTRPAEVLSPEGNGITVACSEVILPSATGQLGSLVAGATSRWGRWT